MYEPWAPGVAQHAAQAQGDQADQVVLEAVGELLGRDTLNVVDVEAVGGPGFEQSLGRVDRGDGGLLRGRHADVGGELDSVFDQGILAGGIGPASERVENIVVEVVAAGGEAERVFAEEPPQGGVVVAELQRDASELPHFNQHGPHMTLDGATPDEVYFQRRPACRAPRFEPRAAWPRGSPCAAPQTLVKGEPGVVLDLNVSFVGGRRNLPCVTLSRAV